MLVTLTKKNLQIISMESYSHYNSDRKTGNVNKKDEKVRDIRKKLVKGPVNQDLITEIIKLLADIDPNYYSVYRLIKIINLTGRTQEILQNKEIHKKYNKIIESIINIIPSIKFNIWHKYGASIDQIAEIIENKQDNIDSDLYNQYIKNTIYALNEIQNIDTSDLEIQNIDTSDLVAELHSIRSIMRIINTKNKNKIDSDVYNQWIEKITSVLLYPKYNDHREIYSSIISEEIYSSIISGEIYSRIISEEIYSSPMVEILKFLMTDLMYNEKLIKEIVILIKKNQKLIQKNQKLIQKNKKLIPEKIILRHENNESIQKNEKAIQEILILIQKNKKLIPEYEKAIQKSDESIQKSYESIQKSDELIQKSNELIQKSDESIDDDKLTEEHTTLLEKDLILRLNHEALIYEYETLIQEYETLIQEYEKLKQKNQKLIQEYEKLKQKNQKLRQEDEKLKQKNQKLRQEDETLRQEDEISMEKYEILMEENATLIQKNQKLRLNNETLRLKNEKLRQKHKKLMKDIKGLSKEIQKIDLKDLCILYKDDITIEDMATIFDLTTYKSKKNLSYRDKSYLKEMLRKQGWIYDILSENQKENFSYNKNTQNMAFKAHKQLRNLNLMLDIMHPTKSNTTSSKNENTKQQ